MKKLFAILSVALFVFTACNNNTNKATGDKDMPLGMVKDAKESGKEDSFHCTICWMVNESEKSGKVEEKDLDVRIFQTLNQHSALAFSDSVSIVKIVSYEDTYYDDKEITGKFALIGTYSYQNKEGDQKTVPVYIKYSELAYYKHKKLMDEYEKKGYFKDNRVTEKGAEALQTDPKFQEVLKDIIGGPLSEYRGDSFSVRLEALKRHSNKLQVKYEVPILETATCNN